MIWIRLLLKTANGSHRKQVPTHKAPACSKKSAGSTATCYIILLHGLDMGGLVYHVNSLVSMSMTSQKPSAKLVLSFIENGENGNPRMEWKEQKEPKRFACQHTFTTHILACTQMHIHMTMITLYCVCTRILTHALYIPLQCNFFCMYLHEEPHEFTSQQTSLKKKKNAISYHKFLRTLKSFNLKRRVFYRR